MERWPYEKTRIVSNKGPVRNLRPVPGTNQRIFRSALTDNLAAEDFTIHNATNNGQHAPAPPSPIQQISCILDLRSPSERDEQKVNKWTQAAAWKIYQADEFVSLGAAPRKAVCLLNMTDKITHRLRTLQQENSTKEREADALSGFDIMVSLINKHGLAYLYKLLLGQHHAIFLGLSLITLHLQISANNKVLIHCAQGKDRTGILCMLIESVMGVSDDEIIDDYTQSDGNVFAQPLITSNGGPQGHLPLSERIEDPTILERAPRSVMVEVLHYLRSEYGSVLGYLDTIHFDKKWQASLQNAVRGDALDRITSRL